MGKKIEWKMEIFPLTFHYIPIYKVLRNVAVFTIYYSYKLPKVIS